nr:hypothetical protein [Rhizoctonia sp.]
MWTISSKTINTCHSSFTVGSTRVSNPISCPNLRVSASIIKWKTAFASSIPPNIYLFISFGNKKLLIFLNRRAGQLASNQAGRRGGYTSILCGLLKITIGRDFLRHLARWLTVFGMVPLKRDHTEKRTGRKINYPS